MPQQNIFQDVIDSPAGSYTAPPLYTQKKEGILTRFGKAIIQPVVGLGEDIAALTPEMQQARTAIENLKQRGDTEYAQQLETGLPEKPTWEKVIGDVVGTGLFVVPGGAGAAIKGLKGLPLLKALGAGAAEAGAFGGAMGAASGMSEKKDLPGVISDAVTGSLFGVPFGLAAPFATRAVGAATKLAGTGAEKVLTKVAPDWLYNFVSSNGAVLKRAYGEVGQKVFDFFEKADQETRTKLGEVMAKLSDVGLVKSPKLFWYQGKANKAAMLTDEEAWKGANSLKDKLVGKAEGEPKYLYQMASPEGQSVSNPKVDKAFEVADKLRKETLAMAQEQNLLGKDITPENYFQKITPDTKDVKLSGSAKKELETITDPAQRETLLMGKEGSMRNDVLYNAVFKDKKFSSIEEAAGVLDDWITFVEKGNRVLKRNDNKFLQWMVKTGQAKTIDEAVGKVLGEMKNRSKSLTKTAGALDYKREVDFPFYDPDPRRVLLAGAADNFNRINQAKYFGAKNEVLNEAAGQIEKATGDVNAAIEFKNVIRKITGQIERQPRAEAASVLLRVLQVPKLTFAQIVNIGQNANTLLATDLGSLAHGIANVFKDEGLRTALESGALSNTVLRQAMLGNGSKLADNWLRWSGFSWTETFNRAVAANAGEKYLQKQAKLLIKNPGNGVVKWRLQELGINPQEIIDKGVTKEMKLRAGEALAKNTQFLSRNIDLPGFATSPEGKLFFQFKNFAYQQMKFLKDRMVYQVKNDRAGLAKTLLTLGTIFPMTGEVLQDVRSLVTQQRRPTEFLDRYLSDLAGAGVWGLVFDFWSSAKYGNLAESIAGPALGSGVTLTEDMVQLISRAMEGKGPTPGFYKDLLQQTGIGRIPANIYLSQKKKNQASAIETLQGL